MLNLLSFKTFKSFLINSFYFIVPFIIFIGPFISFFEIRISNILTLVLLVFILYKLFTYKFRLILTNLTVFILIAAFSLFNVLIFQSYLDLFFSFISGLVLMFFISTTEFNFLNILIKGWFYIYSLIVILAIYEIFTNHYLFISNNIFIDRVNFLDLNFPLTFFGNPNDIGQFLVFSSCFFIYKLEKKSFNIFYFILFFSTFFVIINSTSRIALFSFILIILFYFLFFYDFNFIVKCFSFLLILIIILIFFEEQFQLYFDNFFVFTTDSDFFISRWQIYENLINLGINNFFLGAGLGASYEASIIGPHNFFLMLFSDFGFFITFYLVYDIYVRKFVPLFKFRLNSKFVSALVLIIIFFPLLSSISSGNEQRKILWLFLGVYYSPLKFLVVLK